VAIGNLGYLGFKASDLAAWRTFGQNVLGLMLSEETDGRLRFRIDSQAWRISVDSGSDDDLAYMGFEVPSANDLADIVRRLAAAGVTVTNGDAALINDRGVTDMIKCQDPDGIQVEIYYGPTRRFEIPFISPQGVSGFVTDEQGIGHIVLGTGKMEESRKFYTEILGLRLSDIIVMRPGPDMSIAMEFYHCNPRHHTLALLPFRTPKHLLHFMLQTNTLDEVGFALDRAQTAGAKITMSLGRHTNDHMVSFYAQTPSKFDVEYGFGARTVDDATWHVVRHENISTWGHKRASAP
jgi:biphenyl-2,3-diol 1,2-dioxygenase